jgi:hypothetical protein
MTTARCPTCDREGCPTLQPTEHIEASRGECPACAASIDCGRHAVDWRARALAAEADADSLAKASRIIDAILARLGARDTGTGGQTAEAGNARIVHDGMRRLDRAIAAAARWRKVAPLIDELSNARGLHRVHEIADQIIAATQEPTP